MRSFIKRVSYLILAIVLASIIAPLSGCIDDNDDGYYYGDDNFPPTSNRARIVEAKDFIAAIFRQIPDGSILKAHNYRERSLASPVLNTPLSLSLEPMRDDGYVEKIVYVGQASGTMVQTNVYNAQGRIRETTRVYYNLEGDYSDNNGASFYDNSFAIDGTEITKNLEWGVIESMGSAVQVIRSETTYRDYTTRKSTDPLMAEITINGKELATLETIGQIGLLQKTNNYTTVTHTRSGRYIKYDGLLRAFRLTVVNYLTTGTLEVTGRLCIHNNSTETCAYVQMEDNRDPLIYDNIDEFDVSRPSEGGSMFIRRDRSDWTYEFYAESADEFMIGMFRGDGSSQYDEDYFYKDFYYWAY